MYKVRFNLRNVVKTVAILAVTTMFSGCDKDPNDNPNNPLVPSSVLNFTATAGNEQVSLSWDIPSNNGGSEITGYEVTRDNWASKVSKTANERSHTYTGLTNGTEYTFKVRAVNASGAGAESTQTATPTTDPTGDIIAEGQYDDNFKWTLNSKGVFTLEGSGDMENRYQGSSQLPWSEYIKDIKTIVIPAGLTAIGRFTSGSMDNIFNTTSTLKHTSYIVDENNSNYSTENGVLFNKDKTELISYPKGKVGAYTIPQSVISISSWSFSNCAELSSVVMQEGLVNLSYYGFGYCTSLTSVSIPSTVKSEGGGWCFNNCTSLTHINVAEGNTVYASIDGIWFSKTATGLEVKKCPEGREGAVTIPEGATIAYSAFSSCRKITSVSIPNSVVSIPTYAFSYCTNLTSITLPSSVTEINNGAFSSSGIKSIRVLRQEPPTWSLNSGYGTFNNAAVTLYVPIGSKVKYEIADNWKDCANIIEE
ncbi:MAG: leucine-rich repeat protein [Bacteroidetes bacterium]|nr:leucine-rich repeat protein [Bacteroidota bacterium]